MKNLKLENQIYLAEGNIQGDHFVQKCAFAMGMNKAYDLVLETEPTGGEYEV